MKEDAGEKVLIDTHCHLNDPSFEGIIDEVLCRSREKGVVACVVPAYDRGSLRRTGELARRYPGVIFPAYGIHPWYLKDGGLEELEHYLKQPEASAVGEIGLDLSEGMPPQETQERSLLAQLEMAATFRLPVLLHCRRAHDRLHAILRAYAGRMAMVMHSFSGSAEIMKKYLDLGCYVSFSGSVTRQGAKKYHRCAREVPPERLLLETDAPSIATETTVASRVEPWNTVEVAKKVAQIRDVPCDQVCRRSTENARRVFGLERSDREA